ncbi:hypothetical protein BST61_g3285 [Cercospora zeina]
MAAFEYCEHEGHPRLPMLPSADLEKQQQRTEAVTSDREAAADQLQFVSANLRQDTTNANDLSDAMDQLRGPIEVYDRAKERQQIAQRAIAELKPLCEELYRTRGTEVWDKEIEKHRARIRALKAQDEIYKTYDVPGDVAMFVPESEDTRPQLAQPASGWADRARVPCTDDWQLDMARGAKMLKSFGYKPGTTPGASHRSEALFMPIGSTWQMDSLGVPTLGSTGDDPLKDAPLEQLSSALENFGLSSENGRPPVHEAALRRYNNPDYATGAVLGKYATGIMDYYAAHNTNTEPRWVNEQRAADFEEIDAEMAARPELSGQDAIPKASVEKPKKSNEPPMRDHSMNGLTHWLDEWRCNCGNEEAFYAEIIQWFEERSDQTKQIQDAEESAPEKPLSGAAASLYLHPSHFHSGLRGKNTLALQDHRR